MTRTLRPAVWLSLFAVALAAGCARDAYLPASLSERPAELLAVVDNRANASPWIYQIDDTPVGPGSEFAGKLIHLSPGTHRIVVDAGEVRSAVVRDAAPPAYDPFTSQPAPPAMQADVQTVFFTTGRRAATLELEPGRRYSRMAIAQMAAADPQGQDIAP